jgi:hypothetical protein
MTPCMLAMFQYQLKARDVMAVQLLVLGICLCGCADMNDSMTDAFVDPAKYDLYSCKQLEAERKRLVIRSAELQGLIAKADTGVAGPLVSELAYRNDYINTRGRARLAEEVWRRDKCQESSPVATDPSASSQPTRAKNGGNAQPPKSSGTAIY